MPEVGDVLVSSWGYDQTNIDFYEVVKVTPKMVSIVRIKAKRDEALRLLPLLGSGDLSKASRHKVKSWGRAPSDEYAVRLTSYSWAHLWDGGPKADTYTYGGAGH